jgi:hypothetical protein
MRVDGIVDRLHGKYFYQVNKSKDFEHFSFSEACKKFFLRSVNEEYRKYKCMKDKKCLITRTTRTQCQYCRYTKCIKVGMKLSGNYFLFYNSSFNF